jgi:hypothetical protein
LLFLCIDRTRPAPGGAAKEEKMPRTTRAAISLCGLPVRAESVRLLARKLEGDQLALKLERALVHNNSIVALSVEERERIVDVLALTPATLSGLRAELEAQLKRQNDRAAKLERASRYREIAERRAATYREHPTGPPE